MEQTSDQENGPGPDPSIRVLTPISYSVKLFFQHKIWVNYTAEHGTKKAIKMAFDAYAGPDDSQWSEYKKAPFSNFFFIYSNWCDVKKLVVETLMLVNPFQQSRPELALATVEWLKKIKPIILKDLAKLRGEELDTAWEEMVSLFDAISCRLMCEQDEMDVYLMAEDC
ncbi:hypothetical protein FGADI_2673 [Fusarium gaditjirri]|uniref:Uncharacterized protein n=1 Tax=Fusarium gaditjirri TaxID=282569 RepID=A0A8H4THM7_9HYPO|nr:hypothetical protein FGADI_2673 [Fusarium gaditjirri]